MDDERSDEPGTERDPLEDRDLAQEGNSKAKLIVPKEGEERVSDDPEAPEDQPDLQ